MRRISIIFATVGLLVLCAASIIFWVRSYYWSDQVGFTRQMRTHARSVEMYVTQGSVGMAFIHVIDHRPNYNGEPDTFADTSGFFATGMDDRPFFPNGKKSWGGYGFWLDFGDDMPGWRFQDNIRIIEAPLWSILAVSLLTALIVVLRHRNRAIPGVCAKCGYDLRATPHRCPECGIPVGQPFAA